MPETLPVHVSREALHSLDVPATFETAESFDIALINHGQALHVHLRLDNMSEVARIDAGNHYVEADSERRVRVTVDTDRLDGERRGRLKVASGYGAETRWIDVTVGEPDPDAGAVAVDDALATPQPRTDDSSLGPVVPAVTVGGVAVVCALVAVTLLDGPAVWLGVAVLAGGVLTASLFLLRD